jgi:hypothetical protein
MFILTRIVTYNSRVKVICDRDKGVNEKGFEENCKIAEEPAQLSRYSDRLRAGRSEFDSRQE